MAASLEGVKVLVVEDEYLIAALIESMLETAGCIVCGPIPRLAQAVDAASNEPCDIAVLDVNLAGERVYPVADILSRRNVPFVFVTGYEADTLPTAYAAYPCIHKPFKLAELLGTLSRMVKGSPPN